MHTFTFFSDVYWQTKVKCFGLFSETGTSRNIWLVSPVFIGPPAFSYKYSKLRNHTYSTLKYRLLICHWVFKKQHQNTSNYSDWKKVKSPYFTSVSRNSHWINKPEADGVLILLPPRPRPLLSIIAPQKTTQKAERSRMRNCGHTWELNSGPLAQNAAH